MDQKVSEFKLQEWAKIIAAANASNMKRKDWLAANNITKDAFYYWQRKVQKKILDNTSSDSSLMLPQSGNESLVEVPISPAPIKAPSGATNVGAVLYLGKLRIDLSNNASPEFIENIGRMIHHAL